MVPPLDPTDSQLAINFQLSYYEARLTKSDQAKIISVCCGIPRLIKRLVKLAADSVNLQSVIDNPAQDPKLKLDLERIAEFNRANPENVYSTPMLDHLEELTNSDYEQIGPVRFPAHLSRQEYDLAEFLIDHKEEFVSREQMIEAIWKNRMYDINEHALDQMLHRLRHKLATASPKSDLITYRGRGCKLKVS